MLDFKDSSGRTIMTLDDNGKTIIKDKSVAKDIKDNIIDNKEIDLIEEFEK